MGVKREVCICGGCKLGMICIRDVKSINEAQIFIVKATLSRVVCICWDVCEI